MSDDMPSSSGGIGGKKKTDDRRRRRRRRRRQSSPDDHHPYEYITLPGGDRFDIPEGEGKEEWIQFFEQSSRATAEIIARNGDGRPADGINRACILPDSSHRDGSVYRITDGWHREYRISDTGETQRKPPTISNSRDCYPNKETCSAHYAKPMMQLYSIQLGKLSVDDSGPVQIYGYIAIRDSLEPLRNYVFNRSRDDPITLEQGSPIQMIGPKRGIEMFAGVLVEYDMKIKKGEQESDDLQLIDGISDFDEFSTPPRKPFLSRIDGVGGAVDITLAMFHSAVEATVQVDIIAPPHVYENNGFQRHLVLTSSVSGLDKEIQLFDDVIGQPSCGLRSFVVAVVLDTWMHLKFKFGGGDGVTNEVVECCASFKAKEHGHDSQQIQLNETSSVMVIVDWSTL